MLADNLEHAYLYKLRSFSAQVSPEARVNITLASKLIDCI